MMRNSCEKNLYWYSGKRLNDGRFGEEEYVRLQMVFARENAVLTRRHIAEDTD